MKKGKVWINVVRDLVEDGWPKSCIVGKLVKGERREPNKEQAFIGFVKVTIVDSNELRAKKNIKEYLQKNHLGRRGNEGFGKIRWLNYREDEYQRIIGELKNKKFKIRKGLGTNYPMKLLKLLRALMLHDFVHTDMHKSKIFQEMQIKDKNIRETCKKHHTRGEKEHDLVQAVKYYDQLVAYMNRKGKQKANGRYDFENGKINFEKIVEELEERQESAYRLYN